MDHMMNNNTNAAESKLPADLEQIAALLEADGRAVRSAPDAGFEARLAAATRPVAGLKLTGSPADATLISQTSTRRMGLWPMRIAAAVALCGGLIAVRMATMSSTTPGTTNRWMSPSPSLAGAMKPLRSMTCAPAPNRSAPTSMQVST
ncbi:MAG: hypothetical protein NTV94_15850 [Planctomycetota bacterium]|nr:hypothetical protein [Planctomycetota bacterium]